jgi:hypothetical protein
MQGRLFRLEERQNRNPYVRIKVWCVAYWSILYRYHVQEEVTIFKAPSLEKEGKVQRIISISLCNGDCEPTDTEIPDGVWDKARQLIQNSKAKSTLG